MPWGWLHFQSLRRAALAWPEDDHCFARGWDLPSAGLISCGVYTCCIALACCNTCSIPRSSWDKQSCQGTSAHSPKQHLHLSVLCDVEETGTNLCRGLILLTTSGPALRMTSPSLSLLLMSCSKWKMLPCLHIPPCL